MAPARAPASIHVAALALLLAASVQAGAAVLASASSTVGFAQWIFAAAVLGVLWWGILRGYRLAWLWGRYLTLFLAMLVAVTVGAGLWKGQLPWGIAALLGGGLVLPLFTASMALGRPASLRWFDLYCPKCQTPASRGKDFLFREARCGACKNVW
jgi:hypothetical protein